MSSNEKPAKYSNSDHSGYVALATTIVVVIIALAIFVPIGIFLVRLAAGWL